jgi:hypothetical protein
VTSIRTVAGRKPTKGREIMQVKFFSAGNTDALETEVNAWLNVNGDKIDIEHTQTVTRVASNGDEKPGAVYVVSIWYYEITKR